MSGNDLDCAAIHDMVHDYVLAAAPEERNRIELHCANCPHCRQLIDDLSSTASLLAFSSMLVAPPPSAKAALFSRITASEKTEKKSETVYLGSLDALTSPSIPASAAADTPLPPSTPVLPPRPDRRSWWATYATPLATLPLLLALGFVGYWGINTRMQLEDQTETVDRLNGEVQLLNSKFDALSTGMSGIDEYLGSGTAKQYAMMDPQPEKNGDSAYGMLIANPRGDDAVLLAWELDPSIDSYQVVIELNSGETMSVGTVYADDEGDIMQMLDLGTSFAQVASIHVRPNMTDIQTDSQLASTLPDALYATIWPGLGREQDTIPVQQP